MEATEGKNEFELENIEIENAAAEARKEIAVEKGEKPKEEAEEKPKEKPKKEPEEKTEEIEESAEEKAVKAKADEDKEKAKAEKEAAKKKEEEETLIKTEDKDLDEEKRYKKIALIKIRDDEKKKVEDEALKTFADKHKISVEKAREELEHITKIKDKYKDDDRELPLAFLNIQRLYTKTQEDLKKIQEAAPIKSIERLTDDDIIKDIIDAGKITIKGKPATREQIIESYRVSHPNSENIDDDTVLAMTAEKIRQGLINQRTNQSHDMKLKAKDKRAEVISSIDEKDKEFLETVKDVVNNHSDEAILSDSFSVQDVIRWAKGEKYDELVSKHADEIKKAHDEGFRKGKEDAKILGIKSSETTPKESGKKAVSLTDVQKKEALDMFDTDSMTDDEKFQSYIEVTSKRRKKQ